MRDKKNKKVVKKRKLKKKAILIFSLIVLCFSFCLVYIYNINITNIYIIGNDILSDQEIMLIAKIDDYPNTMKNDSKTIEKRLESNNYIRNAIVKKKGLFNEVYITVEENIPLFYYQIEDKTILYDGEKVEDSFNVPTVTNEINENVYDEFLECMRKVDKNILIKISEIKYDPNDIDEERFYLAMTDGNYVYLTLNKFSNINNYIEIVKTLNNTKGILYLDSGEYFEIFESE